MRQIILDTETTGLNPADGHRIIEIGCVEVINRRITGRYYQQYINPLREIDEGASDVHGLTQADLSTKPEFSQIAEEFLAFVDDSQLIIHNASFDIGFLDAELERLKPKPALMGDRCEVFDSLDYARNLHPGQRNSLDALCKRYQVSNAHRQLHGALLDAELLAEVYLYMTGGQTSLSLDSVSDSASQESSLIKDSLRLKNLSLVSTQVSEENFSSHNKMLARMKDFGATLPIWK
jgi:DNA polymerase-3 subunit epsilon